MAKLLWVTVELTALSSYPFGDVYGQTLPESVITATTNNFGVFNFTFIDDGQNPYIGWNKIKIVKDRGDKLVWNQSIISIAGSAVETNIGTFSLLSTFACRGEGFYRGTLFKFTRLYLWE